MAHIVHITRKLFSPRTNEAASIEHYSVRESRSMHQRSSLKKLRAQFTLTKRDLHRPVIKLPFQSNQGSLWPT